MRFAADLHIHSHFSLATSRELVPEHLDFWARIKGLSLLGTGDFTHPGWLEELKEKLIPAEQGLFRLKPDFKRGAEVPPVPTLSPMVRFILSAEISSIYKKNGRVRKVHSVILAPDFACAEKINQALLKLNANLSSDGRPILGLDARDLLEITLESSPDCLFIPAHIWTPWFSVLGSKSGFDNVRECFDDLTPHIKAVETGLSTDPAMNAICSFLDAYTLLSNSDAHSPEKLGRNANLFDCPLDYYAVKKGLTGENPDYFLGTIDLYPQEGKYHYDGHRKCGVRWNPLQTLENQGLCPHCGRPVTVGVMNRVAQLADRENPADRPKSHAFHSIIPLKEILSEIRGVGPNTKTVHKEYMDLIRRCGPELHILVDMPPANLTKRLPREIAEAVQRMRERRVLIEEGFDGEFGCITVFRKNESSHSHPCLFEEKMPAPVSPRPLIPFDLKTFQREYRHQTHPASPALPFPDAETPLSKPPDIFLGLTMDQKQAVEHKGGPALILAGPGSGKTRTLTAKIAHLILKENISPDSILALTFTNKAAGEIKSRLEKSLGNGVRQTRISTFHALGYGLLQTCPKEWGRSPKFTLIDENERIKVLVYICHLKSKDAGRAAAMIREFKQNGTEPVKASRTAAEKRLFYAYEQALKEADMFDIDDCIFQPLQLFARHPEIRDQFRRRFQWILVDEYQDINPAQYHFLLHLAAGKAPNLIVIGDPDQAIYGFRGASVRFIRRFQKDFPRACVYPLTQSFRCSNTILSASCDVISSKSKGRMEGREEGVRIILTSHRTDKGEAEFIARTIEDMIGGLRFFSMDSEVSAGYSTGETQSLSDFAVLARTHELLEPLEKAFADHSIPCQVITSLPLTHQEPSRSVIELFKLALHPQLARLRKQPPPENLPRPENRPPGSLLQDIIQRFFPDREDECEPLTNLASRFSSPEEFLRNITLGSGIEGYDSTLERAVLMTLHAAKGLEFPCVFIIGCSDKLLPYNLFPGQKCDDKEEERLLYVGMTRAQKYLFLSHAEKRHIHGRNMSFSPSPFIERIKSDWLHRKQADLRRRQHQFSLFDKSD